ncbi:MAG TPA: MarR family winged helix-turn-helix transcriptional regulator [Magnetospirillaceae bacterium]|nr:MarR family winged helix-turn-helix transcriptional regulator [Magnetospirillaceae bacterium]
MRASRVDPERLEHCACFSTRKAARAVTRAFDTALAPCGLESTQFTVLAALAGEPHGVSSLAQHLAMDRSTVTRNIQPLVRRGLVAVRRGRDARRRDISLTAAGLRKLKAAMPVWRKTQQRTVSAIGRARYITLLGGLSSLSTIAPQTRDAR